MRFFAFLIAVLWSAFAFADISVPRAKQYAWTTFDVSQVGGNTVAGTQRIVPLGLSVPSAAFISDVYVYINTQFAASGTESLSFQCYSPNDLMAFTSVKNLPADRMLASRLLGNTFNGGAALIPASPTALNFSQGFGSVPTDCGVSAVIQGTSGFTPYTAGKATLLIEYFRL